MNIKLLGARILIKAKDEETKTESGLIVPPKNDRGDIQLGEVVAVGPGRTTDQGTFLVTKVAVGNNVLFQYGTPISIEGKSYLLVTEDDIVAIV